MTDVFDTESALLKKAKSPDTPENFEHTAREIAAVMSPAGARYRVALPPRGAVPRVAFMLPTAGILAHTVVLSTFLRGLKQIGAPYNFLVFTLDKPDDTFRAELGVEVVSFHTGSIRDRWLALQAAALKAPLDALVHVSSIQGLAFAAAMRCAHKHIWWSMKWHAHVPGVDGYISTTGGAVAPPWHACYCALPELFKPELAATAQFHRRSGTARVVFGTLARENKYTPAFAEAVKVLLRDLPDCIFVYSGRTDSPLFAGVERAQWIGWVDTALWAHIIDVFLDTWPFHCGVTAWEAVAARKPVVMMDQESTDQQAWLPLQMKARGWDVCAATDVDGYVTLAKRMANGELTDYVESNHAFYKTHMRDEARMAREVSAAIVDILKA